MIPSIILSAAYLPAARIGGGGFSLAPAVTSFADDRASVAPTVSGCIAAGFPQGLRSRVHKLAGGFGSRRFSEFGAVAGSSSPRADAKYDADQRLCIRHAPGALTECATSETSAGGFQ